MSAAPSPAIKTPSPASSGTKPIVKHQFGNISVAVFVRQVNRSDGTAFGAKNFVLEKSWKDGEGNWQNQSITLHSREILAVQQALTQAFVDSYEHDDED